MQNTVRGYSCISCILTNVISKQLFNFPLHFSDVILASWATFRGTWTSSGWKTCPKSFPTETPSTYVFHALSHNMRAQMMCQQFARSVEDCEKWIRTSPSQSMFALQQVLVVNEEFAMTPTGTEPLTNLTDMTPGSAGDLCNLLMLYRLVEVMAITSGKTSRERVPRHYRFPGLSDPKFKVLSPF